MLKKDGEEMRLENIENEEKIRKEVQWERENRKKKRENVYVRKRRKGEGEEKVRKYKTSI